MFQLCFYKTLLQYEMDSQLGLSLPRIQTTYGNVTLVIKVPAYRTQKPDNLNKYTIVF